MPLTVNDAKRLIKLLGPDGAIAGLRASRIEVEVLRDLAAKAKIPAGGSDDREAIIASLIEALRSPELRPTDELLRMSYDELVRYFADLEPSNDDLMKIMRELNYKVSAEDKKHLRRFVARQISETALFSNVAGQSSHRRDDH